MEYDKRIKLNIRILDIIAVTSIVGVSIASVFYSDYGEIAHLVLAVLVCFSLVLSVFRMRKNIKSINFTLPNEKLITIHLTNFILWLFFYVINVVDYLYYSNFND